MNCNYKYRIFHFHKLGAMFQSRTVQKAIGMSTESIMYPGYIMGNQLKEAWSEGLTRIEVSFYA